jgi:hypothetical protein
MQKLPRSFFERPTLEVARDTNPFQYSYKIHTICIIALGSKSSGFKMKFIITLLFLLFTPQMLMADSGQDDASAKFENTLNADEAKLYKEELARLMGMCKPDEKIEGTHRTVCGELELTLQKAVKGDFDEQATIWHIYKYGYFYYGSAEVDTNGQVKEREEIWYSRMSDNLSKQLGAEGFKLYKEELEYLKGVCEA